MLYIFGGLFAYCFYLAKVLQNSQFTGVPMFLMAHHQSADNISPNGRLLNLGEHHCGLFGWGKLRISSREI